MEFDTLTLEQIRVLIKTGECTNQEVIDYYHNEWWDDPYFMDEGPEGDDLEDLYDLEDNALWCDNHDGHDQQASCSCEPTDY